MYPPDMFLYQFDYIQRLAFWRELLLGCILVCHDGFWAHRYRRSKLLRYVLHQNYLRYRMGEKPRENTSSRHRTSRAPMET